MPPADAHSPSAPSRSKTDSQTSPSDPFANLHPSLHTATLNSVTAADGDGDRDQLAPEDSSRLSAFAQHVLGGRGHDDAASLLAFSGAGEDGGLFEQGAHQPFTELLDAEGSGHDHEHDEEREHEGVHGHPGDGHGNDHHEDGDGALGGMEDDMGEYRPVGDDLGEAPPPPDRSGRRGKRRREDEQLENGQGLDPVRMKKDSHKEVERRRRENINDGINEIAKHIPGGMEKQGKGAFLRRAAQYLEELNLKGVRFDEEIARRDAEKAELQTELAHLQSRLADEHDRSIRYETSWREAEDRAASSQFELERLKQELEDVKKQYGA